MLRQDIDVGKGTSYSCMQLVHPPRRLIYMLHLEAPKRRPAPVLSVRIKARHVASMRRVEMSDAAGALGLYRIVGCMGVLMDIWGVLVLRAV
eukprot:1981151-Amphidinium_carterae.1